jgi:hypothetical protein
MSNGNDSNAAGPISADATELILQAEALFDMHDNASRVIGNLDLPVDELPDNYRGRRTSDETFEFGPMVRLYLYRRVCDYSQSAIAGHLERWPYLLSCFGLSREPRQPTISHTERRRFPLALRRFLDTVAEGIREVAGNCSHGSEDPPSRETPDPSAVAERQPIYEYVDDHAPEMIETLLDEVMPAFDTGRAENAEYADRALWEQQTLMSLTDRSGTRSAYRTFNKFHESRPHHDTHVRAVKKLGTPPDYQYTFEDFVTPRKKKLPVPRWRRVADTIISQFSDGVGRMLNTVKESEMFSEPVVAAIDTTGIPYHVSPYERNDDMSHDEDIITGEDSGKTRTPRDDYPEMVNGTEKRGVYEYQYATLTVIGRNAPLVVAVEPVKQDSAWTADEESVAWAEAVDRLMEQANELLDISLVMADKAFDSEATLHVLDQRHDVDYLIPKRKDSNHLREQAAEVREDPAIQARVERDVPLILNRDTPYIDLESDPTVGDDRYSHDTTLMHVPANRDDWIVRNADDTGYAIFITNHDDVEPLDAESLVNRYSERWDIENEYKNIKPMVPSIASTDYRMRFFSFTFSCLLYNLWRSVDHELKDMTTEAVDGYGRGVHEERLDPLVTLADFLASCIVVMFRAGWDPPDTKI